MVQRTIVRLALPGGKTRAKAPPYSAADDPARSSDGNGHVEPDRAERVLAAFP